MTSAILQLTSEMEKLSARILDDLTSTLVNSSGSLKDIECGTRIKIPMGAGYVSYYKSVDALEGLTVWIQQTLEERDPTTRNLNCNDET